MSTDPGPEVRTTVVRRSEGVCERCEARPGVDVHHRRPRGSGGSTEAWVNLPANLVHLCRSCHAWVESNRTQAITSGWLVSLHADATTPENVVLTSVSGGRFVLLNDGSKWVRQEPGRENLPTWF